MRASLSAIIRGRVQGVCFRASTQDKAESLGLCGWVKNCGDGSVELYAEGPRPLLEDLLAWCHKGPPAARVREVVVRWGDDRGDFDSFSVVR